MITEQLEIVELLLRCGADPNIMDHAGNMPIHLAAQRQLSDITGILVQGPALPPGKSQTAIEPIRAELNVKNLDGNKLNVCVCLGTRVFISHLKKNIA